MKFTVTNIKYDTTSDSGEEEMSAEDLGLPEELEIEVDLKEHDCYEAVEQYIEDQISNITGYCHEGFATSPEIGEVFAL